MKPIESYRRREKAARRRPHRTGMLLGTVVLACAVCAPAAHARDALIAVATNFSEVLEALQGEFEQASGRQITISSGSTGKLYAQIRNGAPYDALLAADQASPQRLEAEGSAVAGSRFTYAVGRLVLWSTDAAQIGDDPVAMLRAGEFRHLAIANPELAPYGLAATEVLGRLSLHATLADRIVTAENVGQAYAMVASGNAELGFVALSSLLSPRSAERGSRWVVPTELYTPIRQDAVLLQHGAANPTAGAFLDFLRGPTARSVIERFGYANPRSGSEVNSG